MNHLCKLRSTLLHDHNQVHIVLWAWIKKSTWEAGPAVSTNPSHTWSQMKINPGILLCVAVKRVSAAFPFKARKARQTRDCRGSGTTSGWGAFHNCNTINTIGVLLFSLSPKLSWVSIQCRYPWVLSSYRLVNNHLLFRKGAKWWKNANICPYMWWEQGNQISCLCRRSYVP